MELDFCLLTYSVIGNICLGNWHIHHNFFQRKGPRSLRPVALGAVSVHANNLLMGHQPDGARTWMLDEADAEFGAELKVHSSTAWSPFVFDPAPPADRNPRRELTHPSLKLR